MSTDCKELLRQYCWALYLSEVRDWLECVSCNAIAATDSVPQDRKHDPDCPIGKALERDTEVAPT